MSINRGQENMRSEPAEALLNTNQQLWSELLHHWNEEEELRLSHDTLRAFAAHLLKAREDERKLLSRQLHDGLSQSLTAIKLSIENGLEQGLFQNGSQNDAAVGRILGGLRGAIEELHHITSSLYPSMLDDLGIVPAVSCVCREFKEHHRSIQLETDIDIQEHMIPAALKPVIFRILQEALGNIARHAKADSAAVILRQNDTAVELVIEDSGAGLDIGNQFAQEEIIKGTGIAGMRWRARLSGGALTIAAERDVGTRIRVTWPLH